MLRTRLPLLAATIGLLASPFAQAADTGVKLFKIVTVKDEIVIGLSGAELEALGGSDASAVGRQLAAKGEMAAWRFAVRKSASGALEYAPLSKISLQTHESLRVEPYETPLPIIATK